MDESPQRVKYEDITSGLGNTFNANHWILGEYSSKTNCLCPVLTLFCTYLLFADVRDDVLD